MLRSLLVSSAIAIFVFGCSSSTSPSTDEQNVASTKGSLSGVYRTDAPNAAFTEIEFELGQYRLVPRGCGDASCHVSGNFVIDEAAHLLRLRSLDGEETTVKLEILKVRSSEANGGKLAPRDALTNEETKPLVETEVSLIEGATLNGDTYNLDEDDTDSCKPEQDFYNRLFVSFPNVWGSPVCPASYGRNQAIHGVPHCYVKNDPPCSSSASSCLGDKEGNNAYTRWMERSRDCSRRGGVGIEGGVNGTYVWMTCCQKA